MGKLYFRRNLGGNHPPSLSVLCALVSASSRTRCFKMSLMNSDLCFFLAVMRWIALGSPKLFHLCDLFSQSSFLMVFGEKCMWSRISGVLLVATILFFIVSSPFVEHRPRIGLCRRNFSWSLGHVVAKRRKYHGRVVEVCLMSHLTKQVCQLRPTLLRTINFG